MSKTLVILAAGIGSRFGGGIKQLTPVGPGGEIIIDYSIHDAIKAGFDRVLFIIRHDIEKDFTDVIGRRIESVCADLNVKVDYAFQEINDIPIPLPEGRTKPWGTGHALLACRGMLDGPFAVINSDDYYGTEGFKKAAEFLDTDRYGLVGYVLRNTLSDNGGVTRGICVTENGSLTGIDETKNIEKTSEGGARSGDRNIPVDSLVSMNFWCYPPEFMDYLETDFPRFLDKMTDPLKEEYLLPVIADAMLKQGTEISVIPTDDCWFGVTYAEDKASVIESFKSLYEEGIYNRDLYSDLK